MERGRIASAGVRRLVGSVMPWSGQDGVRVERGWSKDRARAARAQWRVEKVAQTWKRCIFICIACVLHSFFEFATPCLFHFSTAASLLSFRSCSKENVRGWKDGGVKRDVKTTRVKWSWGDGQGYNEGSSREMRWKERKIFLQVPAKLLSLFWVSIYLWNI